MRIIERDLTDVELKRVHAGFEEHQLDHGNVTPSRTRHSFILTDGEALVGCATGLRDNKWFYLSDLWVENIYRKCGHGAELLRLWENRARSGGARNVFTWTAGFQAPVFYQKQGYEIFTELTDYYQNGHSRFGFRKALA